ncbi:MAG: tryptophan synthase subunit alpha [bacterium]
MSKLEQRLKEKQGLIPYFTCGDPSLEQTEHIIQEAINADVSAIEIGLPFSDPIADGPIIQASHHRALEEAPDMSVDMALRLVSKLATSSDVPLIFMAAANLVFRYGIEAFFEAANAHHLAGLIVPDLNPDTADRYIKAAKKNSVDLIFLVSPLCSKERLKQIVEASTGFVYLMSRVGVTGEQATLSDTLATQVAAIKAIKDIPVAIGFGISSKQQVQEVCQIADAAIVGSYFVRFLAQNKQCPQTQLRALRNELLNLQP